MKADYDEENSHCDEFEITFCCCGRRWTSADQIAAQDFQDGLEDTDFMEAIQIHDQALNIMEITGQMNRDNMNAEELIQAANMMSGDTIVDETQEDP